MGVVRHQAGIKAGQASFRGREQTYVQDCLRRGWITQGRYVERFERAFAEYIGVQDAIAVNSGTAALHLALSALGIGPGDEVIVPALTFVATANAVTYTGAKAVIVEVDPLTWCLDPQAVQAALSARTRAIVPVHLYGVPADMTALQGVVQGQAIALVEDAAEALGAASRQRRVGSIGQLGCFSFYGNKTITTGEGGMVTTNDPTLAATIRLLRGQGQSEQRYWHSVIGYNYRMTDLSAAVGCAQLESLVEFLDQRRRVVTEYLSHLSPIRVQGLSAGDRPGYWAVAVQLPDGVDRDAVIQHLATAAIESRPVFYPLNDLPMYRGEDRPTAAAIARQGLVLPTHPDLSSQDIRFVCERLAEVLA